jgi:DHA2 family multidrug resistance protein-like MFS transporter
VLGSIGIAVYRSGLAASAPAHIPAGALSAARSTLGGALSVAAGLPGRLGTDLLAAARTAFAHGLNAAALGAAIAMLAAAAISARYFRGVKVVPGVEVVPDATPGQQPQAQSELIS